MQPRANKMFITHDGDVKRKSQETTREKLKIKQVPVLVILLLTNNSTRMYIQEPL